MYRKAGKGWISPARLGLLDQILAMTGGAAGISAMAYRAEKKEQAKKEAAKVGK